MWRRAGKFRRVTFPLPAGATGIIRVFVKWHRGIPEVIGLLNPRFPFHGHVHAPDVARALRRNVEVAAIIAKARHAGLIELRFLAARGLDLAVIESALREPDPITWCPRKLM